MPHAPSHPIVTPALPSPKPQRTATRDERQRVLDAYNSGEDWLTVAKHNGMSRSAAYRLCKSGDPTPPSRGGARQGSTKCTEAMVAAMEDYLEEDCTLTLVELSERVLRDFGVKLSTSTVSAKLATKLLTVKQVRREPSTCNNEVNKTKRKAFAEKLIKHISDGDYIVYYDETNYNLFCMRNQGRAVKGERAVVKLPPSQGKNLQVQCAVSTEDGLVLHQLHRGSIRMAENAAFAMSIYSTVKGLESFQRYFEGRKIVIVLDNAPAHNQTETRLEQELGDVEDLVLLRLGPYSPMLNPIEGCFSVFKSKVKKHLAAHRVRMFERGAHATLTESRMKLLEDAAEMSIGCMHRHLVVTMALHCQRAVADALKLEDMQYGT